MPNSQIVADIFHIMTEINKELDTQRKREKRKIKDLIKKGNTPDKSTYKATLARLKNSKYPLLKNEDKLTKEQLEKLIQGKNVSSILKETHEFKEKI
ncbi:MAG: transposase [Anabaena sp. CoA2_C59]|jgi:transposase|uniref:transposase n=1 Tax=Aphanizomenon TaxID=1175 RepID=UPI001F54F924|nr:MULTISPECIES: transposase [Aphanizomenon]MCE2905966.1 transposase [Anabaena sp. CoA2_C59]MDJ0506034.1 transposase [Nostocales cyanobacterium LE14-WE12]